MNFNILNEKKHIIKAYYVEVSVNYAVFHRLRLIVILCIGKQTFCKIQKQKNHPLSVQGPRWWGVQKTQIFARKEGETRKILSDHMDPSAKYKSGPPSFKMPTRALGAIHWNAHIL